MENMDRVVGVESRGIGRGCYSGRRFGDETLTYRRVNEHGFPGRERGEIDLPPRVDGMFFSLFYINAGKTVNRPDFCHQQSDSLVRVQAVVRDFKARLGRKTEDSGKVVANQ